MPNSGWSEHRFVSFDKTPIFYRHYVPPVPARAALLVIHGIGEHGGRYREFVEFLGKAGFEAFMPDLRGFGESGGTRGRLRDIREHFRDLEALLRLAKSERPLFIVAHSFGALTASSWLAESDQSRVRGLVLSSPNFGISVRVPFWLNIFAAMLAAVFPDYAQDNRVDPATLTHDAEILRLYPLDKLNHSLVSVGLYRLLLAQYRRKKEIARRLDRPILVLQAGEDKVTSQADTKVFFEHLASRDKELEVLPGLYHEILNEVSRQAIYARIQAWLLARI